MKKIMVVLLIALLLLSAVPMSAMAQENPKFYSSRTETSAEALFECNSYAGWTGYRTADHWTYDATGNKVTAYCIQHKYDPPVGIEEYRVVNGADYYDATTLKGLQIIASYGYPNGTGGFPSDQAEYATCCAIRWWLAEQRDNGAYSEPDAFYNYDNLNNGGVRPKAGYESLFNWAVDLLNMARAQVDMPHTVTLNPSSLELHDDQNGNYTGSVTVSLTNCNGGYKVPDSIVQTIQGMGGTINGATGNNGGQITVTIPKEGNANKTIQLLVIGLDNRLPVNFVFAEPDRNLYPETGGTGGSRQRMFAVFSTFDSADDATAQLTTPKNSIAKISKVDIETGKTAQGDATLSGAEFKITAAENIAGTSIRKGDVITSGLRTGQEIELFPGQYYIYETKAPTGYLLQTQPKLVNVAEAGKEYTFTFEDAIIKRPISIVKFLGDGLSDNKPQTPEEGAEFEIILKSSGRVVEKLVTNEYGYAESEPLPYGTYIIHQTKGKEGHVLMQDTEVAINENLPDTPYQLIVDNYIERMPLRIVKVDAETGKKIAIPGAKFRILDAQGNYVSQTIYYPQTQVITDWVTDESGTVQLPSTLPYGDYTLVELESPTGYVLDSTPIPFKISYSSASTNDPQYVEVVAENAPIKGQIKIYKTGDQFTSVQETETEYGKVRTPVFETGGLPNVVFDIIAAEDIIVNQDIKAYKGDIVDTVTTDEKGVAISKELYLGNYQIVEKSAPSGYLMSEDPVNVVLESQGQDIPLVEAKVEIGNEYQKASIHLEKIAESIVSIEEDDAIHTTIETIPGSGFVFGLFTAEDILTVDGQQGIMLGDLVSVGITDETGTLTFEGTFPHGQYVIREIYVNTDYENNQAEYPVDLSFDKNADCIEISLTEEPILNEIIKIPMTITKYDITGETTIPGTTIEVYDEEGNVIYRDVTGKDGTISDILVQKGHKYTFKEVLSAEGYALNTAIFEFEVSEDGEIIGDDSIRDEYSRFELLKKDNAGNPLPNCKFGLYDLNDQLIMTAESDENGIVRFEPLPFGQFYIKEIEPAEGYQLSDKVITITVDGKWINSSEPTDFENIPIIKTAATDYAFPLIITISAVIVFFALIAIYFILYYIRRKYYE